MHSKVDTHVHTYYSGISNYKVLRFPESVTKPAEQVENARKNGMDMLCITDHDAIKGAFEAQEYAKRYDDFKVIAGEEVSTADGEVLGYWLNELIPPGLSIGETIDRIHEQGGVAVAPHPFSFYVPCLQDKIFNLDLEGIEVINGGHVDNFTNKRAQDVFKENEGRWAPFSGSDAHSRYTTGFNWTEFEGYGEEDFRKAILSKKTIACGHPAPAFNQVQWSMEVVLGAQKMLLKALFHKLEPNPDNPLISKMISMSDIKKVGGVIGGFLYLIPPTPFIGEFAATTWLRSKSYHLLDEIDSRFEAKVEQTYIISFTVPSDYAEKLMDGIDEVMEPLYPGYRRAFSISDVVGTFKPEEGSRPFIGTPGKVEYVDEKKIEFTVKQKDLRAVLHKIRLLHPYQEPVINVTHSYGWKSML